MTRFFVLLNNETVRVSAHPKDTVSKFFRNLCKDTVAAYHIPKNVTYDVCEFYSLKSPVLALYDGGGRGSYDGDKFVEQIRKASTQKSNMLHIQDPFSTTVGELAKAFSERHVHLVVTFSDFSALRANQDALFSCLQVTVRKLNKWRIDDVEKDGGAITSRDDDEFKDIVEALAKPRLYRVVDKWERDLAIARSFKSLFDRNFALADTQSQCTVNSGREFVAFYNVLRCFDKDAKRIKENSSLALKASNVIVNFVHPPFLSNNSSCAFEYHQEKSWDFPIFVRNGWSSQSVLRRFTPKSDWMVVSREFGIPFIIAGMISQTESDRMKMLLQAIALARTGQYLLKPASKQRFFVVAIDIDANMIVSRYLVMQTNLRNQEVSIHRKDFNLAYREKQIDFLREMYNLTTLITELSRDLDQEKRNSLFDIKIVAKSVLSLSLADVATETTRSGSDEGGEWGEYIRFVEEDPSVFETEDIQNILREMNCEIDYMPWGHPRVAAIVTNAGVAHGYLKFVEAVKEIEVLKYLSEIESPLNHTIPGVRFWHVGGGTVIWMPNAGNWLTSLNDPDEHLWSVAQQLFEAVGFMHERNVVHLDLKPRNILIPPKGGRLSIIDFGASVRISSPSKKYTGVVGTEGYIAPEVHNGLYKPMLADLWSCGKTLKELCETCCGSSAECTELLKIAGLLMSRDPEARPKTDTVLERMALFREKAISCPPHEPATL